MRYNGYLSVLADAGVKEIISSFIKEKNENSKEPILNSRNRLFSCQMGAFKIKNHLFSKKVSKKFGAYQKMLYLCTRFRTKNTKAIKKAFFEKIYIDREVVQESSAAFLMW